MRKLVELKLTISIIWWAGEVEDWMVVMVEGGVGGVALSPSNLRRSLELNKFRLVAARFFILVFLVRSLRSPPPPPPLLALLRHLNCRRGSSRSTSFNISLSSSSSSSSSPCFLSLERIAEPQRHEGVVNHVTDAVLLLGVGVLLYQLATSFGPGGVVGIVEENGTENLRRVYVNEMLKNH